MTYLGSIINSKPKAFQYTLQMLKCNCSHGILWKFERTLILSLQTLKQAETPLQKLFPIYFYDISTFSEVQQQVSLSTRNTATHAKYPACKYIYIIIQSLHALLCIWSFSVLITNFFHAVTLFRISAATQRQSREWTNNRKKQSQCAISLRLFFMFLSTCVILYLEQNKTRPNKLSQTFFQQLSSPLWHFITTKSHLLLQISSHCNCSALNAGCTIEYSPWSWWKWHNTKENQQPRLQKNRAH